jgi:nucleoside permease NupC
MSDTELAYMKERLANFAELEGFTLRNIYVEQVETAPAAFEALIEAANRYEVTAVVIPGMAHFSVLGAPASMKNKLEHHTGARVMVANSPPQIRRDRTSSA